MNKYNITFLKMGNKVYSFHEYETEKTAQKLIGEINWEIKVNRVWTLEREITVYDSWSKQNNKYRDIQTIYSHSFDSIQIREVLK